MRYLSFLLVLGSASAFAQPAIGTDAFTARFERGGLVSLTNASGSAYVEAVDATVAAGIHRIGGDHWAGTATLSGEWRPDTGGRERCEGFGELAGACVTNAYAVDPASGDLVIRQRAESPEAGVWGVEWAVGGIPLDMNILLPVTSGLKLTRTTPGVSHTFDYPCPWEAQLVIVEGNNQGFFVWAEDAKGVYKRLTVERKPEGWRLGFITMPYAPFEDKTACDSVPWHVNVYQGDWRTAARQYRDWAVKAFRPTPVAEQHPGWVRDIRCCVIMGLDREILDALPGRLDPTQTLLYVPSWRKAGYDRDYPAYDAPFETLDPFIERAHELGFRVMLHVNYFGCDPLNPVYERFEPYQMRLPWGDHEKDWWLWDRAEPPIKFAYINPAYKPWRDLLVERFGELCTTYSVDALHLDQTLWVYNEYHGPIDGMTAMEGNIALHRELRAALPHVALSGEGLNEATYRHEAFAQRHVWGINHSEGTYSVAHLRAAHPISSYLFAPFTTLYGYLGCAPPTSGQLYAAWAEAYRHYGVIPTLKPDLSQLACPVAFSKHFFDEAALWLNRRVDIDVDVAWPADVAFPFKTAAGEPVYRSLDRRLLCGGREISRIVTGMTEMRLPGSIPGWRAYNSERILGLDPDCWYPYFDEPRDLAALHVEGLPEGFTVDAVAAKDTLAFVRTKAAANASIRLAALVNDARCGSRPFDGEATEVAGELHAPDGGQFYGAGEMIHAHPPWKVKGSGVAYARFTLDLPKDAARFISEVAMDAGAVGENKTDGVTYGVTVRCGEQEEHTDVHTATAERVALALDLRRFAGQQVSLELAVHPGPSHSPTYDWARWYGPRIERETSVVAKVSIAGVPPSALALAGRSIRPIETGTDHLTLEAPCPGAIYLLPREPEVIALPFDVATAQREVSFVGRTGVVLESPRHACAVPGSSAVGGVERAGLFAHPPDQGRTLIDVPFRLPAAPAVFHAHIGIRDPPAAGKSSGVIFIVEVNGVELAHEKILPGAWHEITCDLSVWRGLPVVLSLVTDAAGEYICDWAQWGEPEIRLGDETRREE